MKKLLLLLTTVLGGYSVFAQNTGKLTDSYIQLKNALVNSDSKAATEAAGILRDHVRSEAAFTQKDDLLHAAEKMARLNDLEKQRAAFNDLSVILWKVIESTDATGQAVYYQYCPMKKAYWISKDATIKNPYYGSSMLTCGKVVNTKK